MAENFPQLPHQVKRVHLVDSVREIVDALPDPSGAITVDDHHRILVDVVERVDEAASRVPKVAGLGPVVTLVYQLVLVTVTAWITPAPPLRSEERRVGKECISPRAAAQVIE